MPGIKKLEDVDGLKNFNRNNSYDVSFDLYETLGNSEEELKKFGNMFSDFYYISCPPFKEAIDQRKNIPEIQKILERCNHMANGYPLEILIGKYSEEIMRKANKKAEDKRKEFEGSGITVQNPKPYMYIVGFFGGTTGRTNEYIIGEIKKIFGDKVKTIKANP